MDINDHPQVKRITEIRNAISEMLVSKSVCCGESMAILSDLLMAAMEQGAVEPIEKWPQNILAFYSSLADFKEVVTVGLVNSKSERN